MNGDAVYFGSFGTAIHRRRLLNEVCVARYCGMGEEQRQERRENRIGGSGSNRMKQRSNGKGYQSKRTNVRAYCYYKEG